MTELNLQNVFTENGNFMQFFKKLNEVGISFMGNGRMVCAV